MSHVKLLVSLFCVVSAFKINWNKSTIKTFCSQNDIKDDDMINTKSSIKILGIDFSEDLKGKKNSEEI